MFGPKMAHIEIVHTKTTMMMLHFKPIWLCIMWDAIFCLSHSYIRIINNLSRCFYLYFIIIFPLSLSIRMLQKIVLSTMIVESREFLVFVCLFVCLGVDGNGWVDTYNWVVLTNAQTVWLHHFNRNKMRPIYLMRKRILRIFVIAHSPQPRW